MTELKRGAIDRFLKEPPAECFVCLIHGPDRGLVQARAKTLVDAGVAAFASGDPMARVTLDEEALVQEPSLLAEEADGVSMFSPHKVIFVRIDDPKPLQGVLKTLLDDPPSNAFIVVASANLRKTHQVRKAVEAAKNAVSIACYEQGSADLESMLDDSLRAFGLTAEPSIRRDIVDRLGRDHATSAGEIEKLCLFAAEAGAVTAEAVSALLVDANDVTATELIDAAFAGERNRVLKHLSRYFETGGDGPTLLVLARRHALLIERMRAELEKGMSPSQVMRNARPPIFFKREASVSRALSAWNLSNLRSISHFLDDESVEARLDVRTAAVRVERALLRVASMAKRRR